MPRRLLAQRVEGNLLAAAQEIDKLVVLHDKGRIDAAEMESLVADSARYDAFKLTDAAFAGDGGRALRILAGLRAEGDELIALMGWLVNQLQLALRLANARDFAAQAKAERLWQAREQLFRQALRRAPREHWLDCLARAARIDRIAKGREQGDAWLEAERLIAAHGRAACGARAGMKPLAIFGGTFDPVHLGHLCVAWEAGELLGCRGPRWCRRTRRRIARRPWPRAEQRVAMLRAALRGQERLGAGPARAASQRALLHRRHACASCVPSRVSARWCCCSAPMRSPACRTGIAGERCSSWRISACSAVPAIAPAWPPALQQTRWRRAGADARRLRREPAGRVRRAAR